MYRSQTTLRASWRQAFDAVIERYTHVKSTHGTNGTQKVIDPRRLEQPSGTLRSHKLVQPSLSDFLCDVELAAKWALSEVQMLIFRQCFMEFTHDPERVKEEYMTPIKENLGRVLKARKIYPLGNNEFGYFKIKDVR